MLEERSRKYHFGGIFGPQTRRKSDEKPRFNTYLMMEMMLESYTLDLSFTWLKNMEHLEKEVESKILFSLLLGFGRDFVREKRV